MRRIDETIANRTVHVLLPPSSPRFVVIELHDFNGDTLTRRPDFLQAWTRHQIAVVLPDAGPTFWVDKPCPGFESTPTKFVNQSVVSHIQERWPGMPLGVCGLGMGGQGAMRLAFREPKKFPIVAAVSPWIDVHDYFGRGSVLDTMYTSREQCRQDSVPMHIDPTEQPMHTYFCSEPPHEPWLRGCDRLHEKLKALGVEHTYEQLDQPADAERIVGYLAESLLQQSRRLL